ncbi:MAG: carboxypeptidase-like regulatory domain-containing protein [Bacteroidales bacterium]|nr:carboxypeptidase-like regulatory domain-containing protein [Bacteroidales bacterium]MCF8390877.1 carboxypeptidase-like regulatory domain-containing protein [Bacteroidales bacterium]
MKTKKSNFGIFLGILFLFPVWNFSSSYAQTENSQFISYLGVLKNAVNNDVLPFASIVLEGTSVATVSNADGEFTIKVDKNNKAENLEISFIGYKNKNISLSEFENDKPLTIKLEPVTEHLKELTVRPANGSEIIRLVLNNVSKNYSTIPMAMTGFYRETIKNRKNYVAISEAIVNIYKSPYNNDLQFDQVKIDRGRKSSNVEKMDTLLIKLQGGPAISMLLDVVKNPYNIFTENYDKIYVFDFENVVSINDRLHYVIDFKQNQYISDPYFYGKLYIDIEKLAISDAIFSLNLENEEEATRVFIRKKPAGVTITPLNTTYRASYTIQEDQWYFNYARAEVIFEMDWEKKLFNSTISLMSELAITDRLPAEASQKIERKERFGTNDFMEEEVQAFFDPNYWGDYNLIEPDASIEQAIRKLYRKYK